MKNLIVITVNYPFGGLTEKAFIEPELEALRKNFDRVIFMPLLDSCADFPLPGGIESSRCIVDSVYTRYKFFRLLLCGAAPLEWRDDSMHIALAAGYVAQVLKKFCQSQGLDSSNTLCYSFWLDYSLYAMTLLKRATGIKYVGRIHSFSIESKEARTIRRQSLEEADGIFGISRHETSLIRELYPTCSALHTVPLGIEVPPEGCAPACGEEFRMVSCSRVVPLKRLELNIAFMRALAAARPEVPFRLVHLGGDANEVARLHGMVAEAEAQHGKLPNLEFEFTGNLPHDEIMQRLLHGNFHAYMLLSRVEGMPVAMLEAMACGLPCFVTDVGAVSEALGADTGAVLPANPSEGDFLAAVLPYVDDRAKCVSAGRNARLKMQQEYDARRLRPEWAKTLAALLP